MTTLCNRGRPPLEVPAGTLKGRSSRDQLIQKASYTGTRGLLMVDVRHIANVLGGAKVLRRRVVTLAELSRAVERGLPKTSLGSAVRHVFAEPAERRRMIYRVVPEATYKR